MTATNPNMNIVQHGLATSSLVTSRLLGWRCSPSAAGQCNLIPVHPTIRCICFFNVCVSLLYFLQQLTKEQLVLVLPLLNHLKLQKVIMCAYTVVALSCILSMCAGGSTILMYACPSLLSPHPYCQICRFSFVGLQPFAPQLPNVLLVKIGVHQSLGHMVECNFLMHCLCAFHGFHVGA
jgi:hypothetical protein